MVDFRKSAVYRTVDIALDSVVDVLGKGIFGDKKQQGMWNPNLELFNQVEPIALVEHHRKSSQSGSLNQSLFVVVDSLDWENKGLLVVNLNFKGYIDAIRQKANVAGDDVLSMNIGNTTWFENLCNGRRPLFPRKSFAVYIQVQDSTRPSTRSFEKHLEDLEHLLQGGLGRRKSESDLRGGVCVSETFDLLDMAKLKSHHKQQSKGNGLHPTIFIVVDKTAWDASSVLIFGIDGRNDGLRVEYEMVVELVQWIYVEFVYNDSKRLGLLAENTGELLFCSGEPRN